MKNKKIVIAVVIAVLLVVCAGLFFGINSTKNVDATTSDSTTDLTEASTSLMVTPQDVPEKPEEKKIRNVIYLIGDGMGFNHLEMTKSDRDAVLVMDSFEIKGSSRTASLSDEVTDSAAGGTALATGTRTGNKMIGVYYDDEEAEQSYPKNITELCLERGMLTGVITTEPTSAATPAAFSAHTSDRNNTDEIAEDQLASGIDLIWGEADDVITVSSAEENGYKYIETYDEMMALEEGVKSFAQFTNSLWATEQSDADTPTLEQMAVRAVDVLDDTEEGFFLMIEGAHIDKHSHDNNAEDMAEALIEFDKTVEAMLEYAKEDGETLVVVTADHETGGITGEDGYYEFTRGNHSSADVPIRVYGSDDVIENGEVIDNCQLPVRIAAVLGFEESQFPISVNS